MNSAGTGWYFLWRLSSSLPSGVDRLDHHTFGDKLFSQVFMILTVVILILKVSSFFPSPGLNSGPTCLGWRLISVDAVLFEQSQSGPSIYQPSCTQPHTPPATWDCCAVLWLAAAEFTHILPWCTANSGPQGRAGKHLLRPRKKPLR